MKGKFFVYNLFFIIMMFPYVFSCQYSQNKNQTRPLKKQTKINKMMSPLFGSDANECTDVIIPDLTIKVPNKENEKPKIHNNNVQDLSSFLVSRTIIECNNAVAISHGINAAFSTGSQNHHPPQPNS